MSVAKNNPVNEALGIPLAADLEHDLTRLLNDERDVVLAVVDLDRFMRVNDQFGREEGDRVIIETGRWLKNHLPEDAKVYRKGGDEFAVVFFGEQEREEVFLRMEDIRRGFDVKLPDGSEMLITVGIASSNSDGDRYHELMRMAESALYRGKFNGSNRVCLAREDKMVTKTSHYTAEQLRRLNKLSKRDGIGEAVLLREALDMLLNKYDV